MKNLGWAVLLAIGFTLIAVLAVVLIEFVNQTFFNEPELQSHSTIISTNATVTGTDAYPPPRSATDSQTEWIAGQVALTPMSDNLLDNASFEQNPLVMPPGWRISGLSPDDIAEWTTEQAATGRHALKIRAEQPSNKGWPGWITQLDHQMNSGYRIQAKYYTPDGANVWLELSFLDSNNRLLKGFSTGCPRSSVLGQWAVVQHRVKAEWIPRESRSVRIGLRQCLNHTKGRRTTLYLDDVTFQRDSVSEGHYDSVWQ